MAFPRTLLATTGTALALALGAGDAAAQSSVCPDAELRVTEQTTERAEAAVLCLVNVERAARGLDGVAPERRLRLSALGHALDMIVRGFFAHVAPDGRSPDDRIGDAGYAWWAWGENIAAGHPTPRRVMEGWMESEGHCRNVLESDFTELGVGVLAPAGERVHWVQNFGLPRGAEPPEGRDAKAACPVSTLADGVAPATPATSEAAAPATAPRIRYRLRRSGRKVTVSGRMTADDRYSRVRIRLRRSTGRSRVLYRTVRSDGTFSVRVTPPKGRGKLRVSVRARG